MDSRETTDHRITQEAADWLVELNGAGTAMQAQFLEWLRRSPEHVREFLAVTGTSQRLRQNIDPAGRFDIQALLAEANDDVVQLSRSRQAGPSPSRHAGMKWTLAATVAAVAVTGAWWLSGRPESYTTRVGEQRSFKLDDGSIIHLNTDSRAIVDFSSTARNIRLERGEALFAVERDPARPFRVVAGETTVQVLGTRFNVYRHQDTRVTVSVIDGAVAIADTRLDAGEQACIQRDGQVTKQSLADMDSAIAWRTRQLVFTRTPLAQVVEEFNRYNTRQIRVDKAAEHDRQITGVFAADRPESLILFLSKDESLQISRETDHYAISARSSADTER